MRGIFTEEILKDSSYYQELVEIGQEKGVRRSIREVMALRFPNEDAISNLDHIHDLERLHEILRIAAKAQSPIEVKAAIEAS